MVELLHQIAESTSDGAILLDRDAMVTYCNEAFARMISTRRSLVEGRFFTSLVESSDREAVTDLLRYAVGAPARRDVLLVSERGGLALVSLTVRACAAGYAVVAHDGTEARHREMLRDELAAVKEERDRLAAEVAALRAAARS